MMERFQGNTSKYSGGQCRIVSTINILSLYYIVVNSTVAYSQLITLKSKETKKNPTLSEIFGAKRDTQNSLIFKSLVGVASWVLHAFTLLPQ